MLKLRIIEFGVFKIENYLKLLIMEKRYSIKIKNVKIQIISPAEGSFEIFSFGKCTGSVFQLRKLRGDISVDRCCAGSERRTGVSGMAVVQR